MEALSKLLLGLHRLALEMPMDNFQERALELLSEQLSFDAAWWGMSALENEAFEVHSSFTYNLPVEFGELWDVARLDDKTTRFIEAPGITLNSHLDTFGDALRLRAFGEKFGIQHFLFTYELNRNLDILTFIGIYRKDRLKPFSEEERFFTQLVVPHLFACSNYNRIVQISQMRISNMDPGFLVALADSKGVVHDANPDFTALLREEWPEWQSIYLPDELIKICHGQNTSFLGNRLAIEVSRIRDWVLLIVQKRQPADALSNRERAIADAFAKGESYKVIARQLAISPATVRHHLRRIYQKMNITDKAQLAQIMHR